MLSFSAWLIPSSFAAMSLSCQHFMHFSRAIFIKLYITWKFSFKRVKIFTVFILLNAFKNTKLRKRNSSYLQRFTFYLSLLLFSYLKYIKCFQAYIQMDEGNSEKICLQVINTWLTKIYCGWFCKYFSISIHVILRMLMFWGWYQQTLKYW